MIDKLLAKGERIRIDAHGAPFDTGNNTIGWKTVRSKHHGWLFNYDGIWTDRVTITGDEYYDGGNTARHRGSFEFKVPADKYYTLKKIDDTWTIVDRTDGAVTESKHETIIGHSLAKLISNGTPVKVKLIKLTIPPKRGNKTKDWQKVPDAEWDVTKVELTQSGLTRVHNTSPGRWFELLADDDSELTLKKMDGYWLLTSRDGNGVTA